MKPPIYIVNDQDEIIGSSQRNDVDFKKDIYRVTGLWVVNSHNQALLVQRKFTKQKDPGLWGPSVAGTVEVGEEYETNIYKEAEEEIGLKDCVLTKLEKIRVVHPQNYFCQYYGVRLDWPLERFVLQEEEVEQLSWVDIDELGLDVKNNPGKYIASMSDSFGVLRRVEVMI